MRFLSATQELSNAASAALRPRQTPAPGLAAKGKTMLVGLVFLFPQNNFLPEKGQKRIAVMEVPFDLLEQVL